MSRPLQPETLVESRSSTARILSLWARTTYSGFGLSKGVRTKLVDEIADAATDLDATFWLVTLLSGTIATFGLLQNSAAVVIGAMLIAPLLGPLTGLALSVAVGDARLFVQTALSLILITIGLTGVAALITFMMPITPLTDQIAMRTYPTVLDLFIAISSGGAAALVTGSGNRRLSASIPGVAVAVALVPPLGAAGYGLASGLQWDLFLNSLLLFWTNLAGIVLSGLLVYLLLGFGTNKFGLVLREWHTEDRATGVARWIGPLPKLQSLAFEQPLRRVVITLLFVALTSIPLIKAFDQLISDYYVEEAIGEVVGAIEDQAGAFVIERQVENLPEGREVTLTTISREEISPNMIDAAAKRARALTDEPIAFSVIQRVVADSADYERAASAAARNVLASEASMASADQLAARLKNAASSLALPSETQVVGTELVAGANGPEIRLVLTYEGRPALAEDTIEVIVGQLASALEVERSRVRISAYRIGSFPSDITDSFSKALASLQQFDQLAVFLDNSDTSDALAVRLTEEGIRSGRIVRGDRPRTDVMCIGPIGGAPCSPNNLSSDERRTLEGSARSSVPAGPG